MPRNRAAPSPTSRQAPAAPASAPTSSQGRRRGPSKQAPAPHEATQRPVSQPTQSHHALRSRSRNGQGIAVGPLNEPAVINRPNASRASSSGTDSRRAASGSTHTSIDDAASTSVSGLSLYGGDDDDRLTSISSIDLSKDETCASDEETFTYQASNEGKADQRESSTRAEDEEETFVYRPSKSNDSLAPSSLLPSAPIDPPPRTRSFSPAVGPHRPPIPTSFAPRTSPYLSPVHHGAPFPAGRRPVVASNPMMPVAPFGPPQAFGPPLVGSACGMMPSPPPPPHHQHPMLMPAMPAPSPMLASFLEENAKRKRNLSNAAQANPLPAYQPLPSRPPSGAHISPTRTPALPAPQTTPGGSAWPTFKPFDPPTPSSLVSPAPGSADARSLRPRPMWQDESPRVAPDPWATVLGGPRPDSAASNANWSPASNPVGKRMRLDAGEPSAAPTASTSRTLPPPASTSTGSIW